jgi:opacity protein-like surface antigen
MQRAPSASCTVVAGALLALPLAGAAAEPPETFADAAWMIEPKGGRMQPALPEYEQFYGDDDSRHFALAFGYRFSHWFELAAETQYTNDDGVGQLGSTGGPGAPVEYTLVPVHVFAKFRFERSANQLLVPYLGAGVVRAYYKQEIELQDDRDGTTDLGPSVRAGLEILMNRLDPPVGGDTDPLKRTYLFIEVQSFETEVDGIDLGGDAWLVGFRFELGGD